MTGFVLDASVALSWCFADEATSHTIALLKRLGREMAFVPSLWTLEVGNILVMVERRKRISYAQITEFLTLLKGLNVQIDHETAKYSFHEILAIAHCEKMTTYYASYLELAMRLGKPLASKDEQLKKVARRLGIEILR